MGRLPTLISKTKIMRGYQCPKCIYLTIHSPEFEAKVSPDKQAVFDQGNMIGEIARTRFPGGTLVDNKPWDFLGSLKRTRDLLSQRVVDVIYEAAFEHNGTYARADVIQYSPSSKKWKVFEVKSSTKVKDEHLDDVALQAWIMANSGLPIENVNVLHLNGDCKFPDLSNLFISVDVTEQARTRYPSISSKVQELFGVLNSSSTPNTDIGPHCTEPNECGFKEHCWSEKNIPEVSILTLPQIKARKWELYSQGVVKLDDPKLSELNPLQERVVEAYKSGRRIVRRDGIKAALEGWKFPLIFFDFETINPAVPRYPGTGPYQQVPFQFSAHILKSIDAELEHHEYFHTEKTDPRTVLLPALLKACGKTGSIVAYYAQFESARLSELAEFSPESATKIRAIIDRLVDPLPVIRENVYDNNFKCSFSLKEVAPALLGDMHSYDGMLVDNGTAAQRAFEEIIADNTTKERRDELIAACLEYCRKDTLVMVELVRWLFKAAQ